MPRRLQLIGIVLTASLFSIDAHGIELLKNDESRLRLMGWFRGRYVVEDPADGDLIHNSRIRMARINAVYEHYRWGGAVIQVEGNRGDILLLDGFGRITPIKDLEIRAGFFPTRIAQDTQLPLPSLPFGESPQSIRSGLVPFRLLGVEVGRRIHFDDLTVLLNVGVHNPPEELPNPNGKLISAFARARLASGVAAHASFVALVGSDNPGGAERPLAYDQQLSASVSYDKNGTRAYLEGLAVLSASAVKTPFSVYAWLSHQFAVSDIALVPGIRYEVIRPAEDVLHQLTAAINLLAIGWRMATAISYELTLGPSDTGHAGFIQLQVGF
ncbi:MAG: hypothetical protein AAF449_01470 [Myxococcota bacterium]